MRNIDPMMHEEIEKRAYEIYLRRGGEDGSDLDDWFAAEQELAQERSHEAESYRSDRQEQSTKISPLGRGWRALSFVICN